MSEASCNANKFVPEGQLTTDIAEYQRQRLLQALHHENSPEVDLPKNTRMDTPGLRLSIAAEVVSVRRVVPLTILGYSKTVGAVIDMCKISGCFGDPEVIWPEDSADEAR